MKNHNEAIHSMRSIYSLFVGTGLILLGMVLYGCSDNGVKPPPPPSDDFVYWAFEEDGQAVIDSSTNKLNGIAEGTTCSDGFCGGARYFDGVDDRVVIPDHDFLDITGSITIALWAKIDPSFQEGFLISKRVQDGGINYLIKFVEAGTDDVVSFQFGAAPADIFKCEANLNDGRWHHLAVSYVFGDPQSAFWVIDGESKTVVWHQGNGLKPPVSGSDDLIIGAQLSASPGYLKGGIDQVRIYNRVLSQTEIQNLYETETPMPANPTAYWSLDDSDNSIIDASGNGLDGTAFGTTSIAGKNGLARNLDGIDDYISVPDDIQLDITDSITIMLWAKIDPSFSEGFLIGKRAVGAEINYLMKFVDGGTSDVIAFQFGITPAEIYKAESNLNDGQWHHLAMSFIYGVPSSVLWVIDGNMIEGTWHQGDGSPIPTPNNDALQMGRQLSTSPGYYHGSIDEVRIYDKALNQLQIKTAKSWDESQ